MAPPNVEDLVRTFSWTPHANVPAEQLLSSEWLVTNGLGGYASGTIIGPATRRYHGLLIAALPAPFGRMMMFNHLTESLRLPNGKVIYFGREEREGGEHYLTDVQYLTDFRLEAGLPVWRYEVDGMAVVKRVLLVHQQNTVHVTYQLVKGDGMIRLKLMPLLHFRRHEAPVNELVPHPYVLTAVENRYEVSGEPGMAPLHLYLHGERGSFTLDSKKVSEVLYRVEQSRGYEFTGALWNPGLFRVDLTPAHAATLVASTESWDCVQALSPQAAYEAEIERRRRLLARAPEPADAGPAGELVLAADQFIITPVGRAEDAARARASGDEVRSVIAGYHWFTDWGRDTMISLEGLTLATGRLTEAGWILRTFAYYVRDGLIPNMFPEGEKEGLYNTADATLWFFHALHRYLQSKNDPETLRLLLPKLIDIVEHHLKGTRFGIRVDPDDGLLRQGAEGYQLTWMDAKVGDWVVTPRRGKAVEINALWYNALRLLENWVRAESGNEAARPFANHAEKARASFNRRFWYTEGKYLYDVVDGEHGDDSACRPNQLFAISLDYPILDLSRWEPVLNVVQERLLTPVGLRSLAPGHRDFKAKYYGDLRARDAAYHQGTVWSWLMGPFIDAWLKVHPGTEVEARHFLNGLSAHLGQACIGSVSEIFDAEPPYTPRGCIAQAWGVAELLRSWLKTSRSQ